jgi:hypothetical protein
MRREQLRSTRIVGVYDSSAQRGTGLPDECWIGILYPDRFISNKSSLSRCGPCGPYLNLW